MKNQQGSMAYGLAESVLWLLLAIGGGIGWVLNVLDVANSDFGTITGLLVLRVIGIFLAPLGVVLGYFS